MTGDERKSAAERSRIHAEAAAWLLRIRNGDAEAAGEEYLEWLDASPEHEAAMARAREAWALFGEQAAAPEIVRARRDALARAGKIIARRWRPLAGPSVNLSRRIQAAAAAVLVAAIALPVLLWGQAGEGGASVAGPATTYTTEIAETRTITLTDNSRVSLDAASAIETRYTDQGRDIALLKGQAHFDVAKNPALPFRVTAGGRTVVATGTSFNIELAGDDVLVTLLEGEVVVAETNAIDPGTAFNSPDASAPVTLKPGQLLIASSASPPTIEEADIEKANAWRHGKVMLDGDTLDMAVRRMNRYSRVRLEVGDDRLNVYRVTGVFNAGDTDAFIEAVEAYFPVEARRLSAGSIVFYPRG